jgi:hypothetical protein
LDTVASNCGQSDQRNIFLGMIIMKKHLSTALAAAFLFTASSLAAKAEDAAPAPAAPAAAPTDTAPANVARPSIAPKTNDTAAKPDASAKPQADAEPAPRRHRRYARRHYHRYAYWEPFPIYFPHLTHRHGIYWSRIPWFF